MAVECRRHAGGTQKITSISMLSTSRSIAAMTRWRVSMGKGKKGTRKMSDTTPRRISCESQQLEAHNEITYVPTSALKSAMAEDQKNGPGRGTLDEDKSIEELDEEERVSKILQIGSDLLSNILSFISTLLLQLKNSTNIPNVKK